MVDLLITNGVIVTWGKNNQILYDHAIYIDDGIICAIAPTSDLSSLYPQATKLDAEGQFVMPGSICSHTHFYGAYARGMSIPGQPPKDFPAVLNQLWWPLDKALDADSIRMSALVCLVDAIKHGTTTLIDHHASPNFIDGSLDVIADALEIAGLRAVLCYEVTDRDGKEKMQAGIAENLRFMQKSTENPLIRGTFGLHASMTLSDDALAACADSISDRDGFHIHVAEHEADQVNSLRRSSKRVVQRLDEYGIWRDKTIAAHCVHIDESELSLLLERGVWISHQPRSNMNNGVGAANIDRFLEKDAKLCLGNDGFSNNMWAEWKAAYLLHKVTNRDPRRANGADIAKMATVNNARLVEQFFPEQHIGELSDGAQADIIFVDYKPFTPVTEGNLPWHIVFGFESSMVTTTIVKGRVLMQDRQLLTLNEAEIAREALEIAPMVWEKYTLNAQNALQSE